MVLSKLKIYGVWEGMKARCYNINNKHYYNYGGRGITICKNWIENSKDFVKWAFSNGYKEGLTLDRIDNNGAYCPENCRWVDRKMQQRNRRNNVVVNYNGENKCLKQWCEDLGISRKAVDHCRKRYGLSYQTIFHRYTKQKYNPKLNVWEDK